MDNIVSNGLSDSGFHKEAVVLVSPAEKSSHQRRSQRKAESCGVSAFKAHFQLILILSFLCFVRTSHVVDEDLSLRDSPYFITSHFPACISQHFHAPVIASAQPFKAIHIPPACCFTYVKAPLLLSGMLGLILSEHSTFSQPDNLAASSRFPISADHLSGAKENPSTPLSREGDEWQNFFNVPEKWTCAFAVCHVKMKPSTQTDFNKSLFSLSTPLT